MSLALNLILKKVLIITLVLTPVGYLFLPIGYYWMLDQSNEVKESWNPLFLYEDDFLLYFIGTLYFLLPLSLYVKKKIHRWILKSITLIIALLTFIIAMGYGMTSTDNRAGFGLIVALSIPLQIIGLFAAGTRTFARDYKPE